MSRRYSIDDLLKLRASPLICKPPGLPPSEEWMGLQDQANKRPTTRGRQDDASLQPEGFHKRANYDSSQRKQGTDPERIVLGPPRRSFASSNGRPFGKHGTQDSEDSTRDKHHERTRTGEDNEYRNAERRGFGGQNNRFGNRQDQDNTYNNRPRRRNDDDEGDGKQHREYDRTKWGSRDNREETGLEEEDGDNGNLKAGFRRDQGRGRFDQPWFRGEKSNEDSRRDKDRGSGWRNNKSRDGDWDIPNKADIDPEWMDSVDNAEPFQAHTQEDFQKWKERMKAGNAGTSKGEQAVLSSTLGLPNETQSTFGAPSPSIISPDPSGNSMDKFFARFNEKKAGIEEQSSTKPAAKTRFASLFGPQPESKNEPPRAPSPNVAVEVSSVHSPAPIPSQAVTHADADQAGFQRILQMLGKKESGPAPPSDGQKPKSSGLANAHSHQRHASPDLVALFKQDLSARQTPLSQTPAAPPGLERLTNSKSPAESQTRHSNTPNKDELLLNLLRQAETSTKPQPQQPYMDNRGPPGQFGGADQHRLESRSVAEHERLQMHDRGGGRSMFDDPAITSMSYSGEMRPRDGQQRAGPNGAPPGFEDAYMDVHRANGSQSKSMHNMPPGLQRPPGLEQMPRMPPGWNQQQGSQGPPPQSRPGPPPGLGSRGMAPFGNPQQPPPPPPMSQQLPGQGPTRPPQQRKYTGDSSVSNFPPGMAPPPGFMAHGPPPGFQHANAAQAAQNYGRFAMGGNEQGPQQQAQPPLNMGRAFMEMYGNDRGGMRGSSGVPMPPGFR